MDTTLCSRLLFSYMYSLHRVGFSFDCVMHIPTFTQSQAEMVCAMLRKFPGGSIANISEGFQVPFRVVRSAPK